MSSAYPSRSRNGGRQLESSALTALLPALALVPISLVALAVAWLGLRLVADVDYWVFVACYLAAGVFLFFRPVQRLLLTRLLGARAPTRQELAILEPVWREVTQSVHLPAARFVLSVLDADELNAFASGGHLVVVTSYAVEVLPDGELAGVLAHELSHHLGLHTIALTVGLWLSLPVLILARIGFFLQSVARAATDSFASGSPGLTFVGRVVSGILTVIAWAFLSGVLLSNGIGNMVGQSAEFQADRRAVQMGFGPHLSAALRRFVASGLAEREVSWRERLSASHPAARTRVARIEAQLRRQRSAKRPKPA